MLRSIVHSDQNLTVAISNDSESTLRLGRASLQRGCKGRTPGGETDPPTHLYTNILTHTHTQRSSNGCAVRTHRAHGIGRPARRQREMGAWRSSRYQRLPLRHSQEGAYSEHSTSNTHMRIIQVAGQGEPSDELAGSGLCCRRQRGPARSPQVDERPRGCLSMSGK